MSLKYPARNERVTVGLLEKQQGEAAGFHRRVSGRRHRKPDRLIPDRRQTGLDRWTVTHDGFVRMWSSAFSGAGFSELGHARSEGAGNVLGLSRARGQQRDGANIDFTRATVCVHSGIGMAPEKFRKISRRPVHGITFLVATIPMIRSAPGTIPLRSQSQSSRPPLPITSALVRP